MPLEAGRSGPPPVSPCLMPRRSSPGAATGMACRPLELPWVRVEKDDRFDTDDGEAKGWSRERRTTSGSTGHPWAATTAPVAGSAATTSTTRDDRRDRPRRRRPRRGAAGSLPGHGGNDVPRRRQAGVHEGTEEGHHEANVSCRVGQLVGRHRAPDHSSPSTAGTSALSTPSRSTSRTPTFAGRWSTRRPPGVGAGCSRRGRNAGDRAVAGEPGDSTRSLPNATWSSGRCGAFRCVSERFSCSVTTTTSPNGRSLTSWGCRSER